MRLKNKQIKIKCYLLARHATGQTVRVSNSGGGRYFPPSSRPALRHIQPLCNKHRLSLPGGKAGGVSRCPPTPSSVEVKERVELYMYPCLSLHACYKINFTLYLIFLRFQILYLFSVTRYPQTAQVSPKPMAKPSHSAVRVLCTVLGKLKKIFLKLVSFSCYMSVCMSRGC